MKKSIMHMLRLCVGVGMMGLGGMSLCASQVYAVNTKPSLRISNVQSRAGKELVTLQFSAPVRYQRAFLLHYPERVVVDLESVEAAGVGLPAGYTGGLIRGVRFAQHNATTSRMVLDLTQPAKAVSVHAFDRSSGDAVKLVVDIVLSDDAVSAAAQQPKPSIIHDARPKPPSAYREREQQPQQPAYADVATQSQERDEPTTEAQPMVTMSPKTAMFVRNKNVSSSRPPVVKFGIVPPSDVAASRVSITPHVEEDEVQRTSSSRYQPSQETLEHQSKSLNIKDNNKEKSDASTKNDVKKEAKKTESAKSSKHISRDELDDDGMRDASALPVKKKHGKPVIVIDAGHGGKDPGASTKDGDMEKHITLSYAKKLADALNKSGRYQARLTRSTDTFILLGERVNIARKAGADMFISLHADSAPATKAQGLSIYTLSENSSDKETAALAEQENNSDNIGGMDLSGQKEEVADILIDLARRETKNKSMYLAEGIVVRMKEQGVQTLRDPHRFAGFKVLKAPDIPSVLVELGFLSTPSEAERLKTNDYRSRVVRGLVAGIDSYFGK